LTKDKNNLLKKVEDLRRSGAIPVHIAIIMDGNGRWAKKKGLPRAAGHRQGVASLRKVVEACAEAGVKYLTLYTFSTENWRRPKDEVTTLMKLIVKSLKSEINSLHENNIRLTTIGDNSALPVVVRKELDEAKIKTAENTKMVMNLALSYSGRWELTEALRCISALVKENKINPEEITENLISQNLTTKDMPDPDLVIRSGGEMRISNFLLWQIAYSEMYVSDVLWPEFGQDELFDAIRNFQKRERRFGLVSEQISKNSKGLKNAQK
jgi:undecaprenyl diphosphate synthase